jgi:5'-nucleotidase / UDP-sugar diphosphatase
MTFLKTKSLALFLCLFLFLPALLPGQQVSLTILHTNDTHGHLLPFSSPSVAPPGSDFAALKERTNIGGIARRATLVNRLRQELSAHGTTVWLVDVGDFSDGTAFSTEYHGQADAEAMNATGYDFGALGNHEFNQSLSMLKKIIGMFHYPVLCANATEVSSGRPLTRAYEIRNVGPLKIALFGLVTATTNGYPATKEGITISGEIETARRMVQELRPQADVVIALSHSGDNVDSQIAAAVPGIDVIIGGHSHSRLTWGRLISHSDKLLPGDENGTVVVQAFQWGVELGRLDLLFVRDDSGVWHLDRHRASLIDVTKDIPEDKTVAAVVERYWKPIAARYGEVIGQAAADFIERGDDLTYYNLVADSVRETFSSEIDLENMGGVRAPLAKGTITKGDLIEMDPFDNTVVTFRISGRDLKKVLQADKPAVSGLRYRIENGTVTEVTVRGKPLQNDRLYSATSNSYFARFLKGVEIKDTGKQRINVLIDYVRKKGTVRPVFDGRRVIFN